MCFFVLTFIHGGNKITPIKFLVFSVKEAEIMFSSNFNSIINSKLNLVSLVSLILVDKVLCVTQKSYSLNNTADMSLGL